MVSHDTVFSGISGATHKGSTQYELNESMENHNEAL